MSRVSPIPRQPLLYAALAFAAGIFLGVYVWRPPVWWLVVALALANGTLYLARRRVVLASVLALAVWLALGPLCIHIRPTTPVPDIEQYLQGDDLILTAHVVRDGILRDAGFGGLQQSVDLETEQVTTPATSINAKFGVRLNLYAKSIPGEAPDALRNSMRLLLYGERVRVACKLRWPRNYRNPGAFDYVGYLAERGIIAQGSAKMDALEVLPGFSGSRLAYWRNRIYRSILRRIDTLWPPTQAAFIDAMVIGDDAFIHRDTRANFQRSGTYHILVVSGMNVGVLAFVLFWVMRRLRASEILASVVVVLFSVAYALLTDVGPPIWRATLMLAIYLGVRLLYRERSMLNAIGGAGLGLLLDPKALLGASFQLTFLSVLIIGALGVPIIERTS